MKHGNRKARNCQSFPQEDSTKEEGAELFEEERPFGENKRNLDDVKKEGKKKPSRFEEFGKILVFSKHLMFEFSDPKEGSGENVSSVSPLIQPYKREEGLII